MSRERIPTRITYRETRRAVSILLEVGVSGRASERGLTKIVNACRGAAWGGSPDQWPEVLRRSAERFVKDCLEYGRSPDFHEFVQNRKEIVRAVANAAWLPAPGIVEAFDEED